jgi:hypothetical protein
VWRNQVGVPKREKSKGTIPVIAQLKLFLDRHRASSGTNLHRLGVSDKVIQQNLRHANVTTTINIYVKMVTRDTEESQLQFESPTLGAKVGDEGARKSLTLDVVRGNLAEKGD